MEGVWETASNQTCHFCKRREASHFCTCTGSLTLFCTDCGPIHQAKYSLAIHQISPIAAISQSPEESKRKYEALTKAAAELRSNVDRLDQCSREFEELMQHCIQYLTQQLQTKKEELTRAIETTILEATNSLGQVVGPVNALWTRTTEELQVFSYTVSTPDLLKLFQSWAYYDSHLKCPNPEEQQPQRCFYSWE